MHICIFESLQLEALYVGDLLYIYQSRDDFQRPFFSAILGKLLSSFSEASPSRHTEGNTKKSTSQCPALTEEETEAQRGQVTCLRPHSS